MSNQSSVYSEKKIAAYESLFKETNFAKPQEVYLTITVAHVFGQAYILEQEGTVEGDPVYSRFVCPLEEITKVYVNDKIKKPWPLFIQCDTNVKGVVHRKRIVVPCLDDPRAIAEQINSVKAQHMEKYEAALEREKQRKREQLESARMKEKIQKNAEKELPPLPSVEKLPEPPDLEAVAEAVIEAKEAEKKAEKKPAKSRAKKNASLEALNDSLEDSFKAFESIGGKSEIKPLPKKPKLDLDDIPDAVPIGKKAAKAAVVEEAPVVEEIAAEEYIPEPVAEAVAEPEPVIEVAEAVAEPEPVVEVAEAVAEPEPLVEVAEAVAEPEPVVEVAEAIAEPEPLVEVAEAVAEPEPVVEVAETIAEPEPVVEVAEAVAEPEPVVEVAEVVEEPAPAPVYAAPAMVNPNGRAAELADFEMKVLKLKTMKDNGVISDEEYAAEKKNLIATLY